MDTKAAETVGDTTRLAVYIVRNKTRIEDALYELAEALVGDLGEAEAYRMVADQARCIRRGWLPGEHEGQVHRTAGDMRELVGLPRFVYAGPSVEEILRSFPGGYELACRIAGVSPR